MVVVLKIPLCSGVCQCSQVSITFILPSTGNCKTSVMARNSNLCPVLVFGSPPPFFMFSACHLEPPWLLRSSLSPVPIQPILRRTGCKAVCAQRSHDLCSKRFPINSPFYIHKPRAYGENLFYTWPLVVKEKGCTQTQWKTYIFIHRLYEFNKHTRSYECT